MKKLFIYLIGFILIFFILPAFLTISKKSEEATTNAETLQDDNNENITKAEANALNYNIYDYSKYKTIKLLHTETNNVEELNIDEYLYGVVSAEMPASYDIEALKAQAVVARTYTIYQCINNNSKHENADICDNSNCCQAWITKEYRFSRWEEDERDSNWNKIVEAVNSTSGKIITYNGSPINAFFHSNSGGTTEASVNIWGGVDYPYLKSVTTSGEDGYTQYSSEVIFTKEELINKLKGKYKDISINFEEQNPIEILELTTSGRVQTIKFGNIKIAGTEARTLLGLKSTNFTVSVSNENIIFSVVGYGHGVGMSQTGADSLAKNGNNYEEIIKHFYTDVEITEVNSL